MYFSDNAPILPALPDLQASDQHDLGVPAWREAIEATLNTALHQTGDIRQVVAARTQAMDELIVALYQKNKLPDQALALFAVGGYGRGELSLHSDIDLLILSKTDLSEHASGLLQAFVAQLWDVGLHLGVAVRTYDECLNAAKDVTVATSILEARLLQGDAEFAPLPRSIVTQVWHTQSFYQAKMAEVRSRYERHHSTEYNLEPDIKNAPGGLRDIHMIGWIGKLHFNTQQLFDLVQYGFLSEKEFDDLQYAESFLWKIRHHLHALNLRDENRLLFDYQKDIAKALGYQSHANDGPNALIERFMRDYYRCAMLIATLSDLLTKHFFETVIEPTLADTEQPNVKPINTRFNLIGEQIALAHPQVFAQHPSAILELFLLMGEHGIKEVRAQSLRMLKFAVRGMTSTYRQDQVHQQLFLANLKQQNYLFHRLRIMKRFGVLSQYLPQFANITGLMQYDLFHRYTVDAHTLLLVRMLHRFTQSKYAQTYDLVSGIYQKIERKEILILAAIFHDIAKGRGGDHSELGQADAIDFCLSHGMTQSDATLVGWLTREHLTMSLTAQKQDISDPDVINRFTAKVGNVTYLNHLYVLTVADINATNPQLWNSWRASLLRQLYTQTRRVLRADIDSPNNRQDLIEQTRTQAKTLLDGHLSTPERKRAERLWESWGDDYFLREIPSDILWHTQTILKNSDTKPTIAIREHRELALDAVQLLVYTQDQPNLFAATMAVLAQQGLDVLDARITTGTRDFALDNYVLLDPHGTLLTQVDRQAQLIDALTQAFANPMQIKVVQKRLPRQLQHFDVPTRIQFKACKHGPQHILSVETLDRPGLLASIGTIFLQQNIEVHAARVTTLGEKAEDRFYITDQQDKALTPTALEALTTALYTSLADD